MALKLKCTRPQVSVPLTVLVAMFGMSTFLHVDAIWVEVPVLVEALPEGWELPAYITLGVAVICNVPPLIYFIVHTFKPNVGGGGSHGVKMILGLFAVALVVSVTLIFFWDRLSVVNGKLHSVVFLTLVIAGGCVNFMSMMIFVGYMVNLPQAYIPAFHTGEGLAGFLFSIFGLIQGSGMYECMERPLSNSSFVYDAHLDKPTNASANVLFTSKEEISVNATFDAIFVEPLYSVQVHFILVLLMEILCFASFILIHFLPYFKRFQIKNNDINARHKRDGEANGVQSDDSCHPDDLDDSATPLRSETSCDVVHEDKLAMTSLDKASRDNKKCDNKPSKHEVIGHGAYVWLLVLTVCDSAVKFGVLDAIITYSALPYGPVALNLATRLSLLMLPVGSFSAYFLPTRSLAVINIHTVVGMLASVYIIVLSAMSPNLPLMSSLPALGSALVVTAWIFVAVTFGYKRSVISSLLREKGERALVWFSICCLTGSFLTNVPMFFFVSVMKLFKDVVPCR